MVYLLLMAHHTCMQSELHKCAKKCHPNLITVTFIYMRLFMHVATNFMVFLYNNFVPQYISQSSKAGMFLT